METTKVTYTTPRAIGSVAVASVGFWQVSEFELLVHVDELAAEPGVLRASDDCEPIGKAPAPE